MVKRVCLLGGGVIGAGWAARLLINGIDVALYDPSEHAEQRFNRVMANALRAYRKLALAPVSQKGTIKFVREISAAVENADFIQESAPEVLEIKQSLLAEADRSADSDVIIASSSSGLLPSDLQSVCNHPGRVIIAHPFNPVYLIPLVEIVCGKQTTEAHKQSAASFYRLIGMHPLIVRKEIDAFISDRLMESVWRESLHLVKEGVATTDEIDQAICYGPGLRWSFMGSFLIYRMGGGEAGMRHFLHQFGPTMELPWARFNGPVLDESLIDTIVEQSDQQASGKSIQELELLRDDCLVAVLQALRTQDYAAGKTYRIYERGLYETAHEQVIKNEDDLSTPLHLHEDQVHPEWVDYNNHMTESRYLQVFGDTTDALLQYIGVDSTYLQQGFSYYTVETHLSHIREVAADVALYSTTQLLNADEKRIHVFHRLHRDDDDTLLATAEMMLLHVDTRASKACTVDSEIGNRLQSILSEHQKLPKPSQAGRSISMRSERS